MKVGLDVQENEADSNNLSTSKKTHQIAQIAFDVKQRSQSVVQMIDTLAAWYGMWTGT